MKLIGAAALAAVIGFACPAFAAECEVAKQLSHAQEVSKAAVESGKFQKVLDLKGGEMVAFVHAANAQFGTRIPEAGLDEMLVISVNGRVAVFGYIDGCQAGFIFLPAMPQKLSAPALLPHGLRSL